MTAVEWLTNHILNSDFGTDEEWQNVFEQAKEMEKQQIIEAFKNGDCNGTFETINAEQYYNETFKK